MRPDLKMAMEENQSKKWNKWFYIISVITIIAAFIWSFNITSGNMQKSLLLEGKVAMALLAIKYYLGTIGKKMPVSVQGELLPSYRRLFWSSVIVIVAPLMAMSYRCLINMLPFVRSTNAALAVTWYVLWVLAAIIAIMAVLVQSGRVKSAQPSTTASYLVSMLVVFLFATLFIEIEVGSGYVQNICRPAPVLVGEVNLH